MFAAYLAIAVCVQSEPAPVLRFAYCDDDRVHVAVQEEGTIYFVHFHVLAEYCAGRSLFARVRSAAGINTFLSSTEVDVEQDREEWSFYFRVPKFDAAAEDVTYQAEIGYRDPSQVDEYVIVDSFAWKLRGGRMEAGTEDEPIFVSIPKRTVVIVGGEYAIRTTYEPRVAFTDLRYGLTRRIRNVTGERAARKISQ